VLLTIVTSWGKKTIRFFFVKCGFVYYGPGLHPKINGERAALGKKFAHKILNKIIYIGFLGL